MEMRLMEKVILIAFLVTGLFCSVPAMAIPSAKCSNADRSVTASFWYYRNLQSESVQVGKVLLNLNGKKLTVAGDGSEDEKTQLELKFGFVAFKDSTVMIVSDGAGSATVYNADGNTLAKLNCGR
jgi:hypothetical protein